MIDRYSLRGLSLQRRSVEILGLVLFASVAVGASMAVVRQELVLLVVAALVFLGLCAFRWRLALAGFVVVLLAFFDLVGYSSIPNLGFRVYLADVIFVFLAFVSFRILSNSLPFSAISSPITGLLLLNVAYGGFALVYGLNAGNDINDVFGHVRRFCLYPLAAFLPLAALQKRTDLAKLVVPFVGILLLIAAFALARVVTGQSWDPDQFTSAGQFRSLSYFTGSFLLGGIGLLYGIASISKAGWRTFLLGVTGLLVTVVAASGYRLHFLQVVLVFPLFHILNGDLRKHAARSFAGLGLLVVAGVMALWTLRALFPETLLMVSDRLIGGLVGFRPEDDLRYYAWSAAIERFLQSPLLGVGIGDQLYFAAINSQGDYYSRSLNTHNILLSLLYQAGIIGAGIFVAIQYRVIKTVAVKLPQLDENSRPVLAGMMTGYFSILAVSMMQPTLESPGAIVAFYLWVGVMLKMSELYVKN